MRAIIEKIRARHLHEKIPYPAGASLFPNEQARWMQQADTDLGQLLMALDGRDRVLQEIDALTRNRTMSAGERLVAIRRRIAETLETSDGP